MVQTGSSTKSDGSRPFSKEFGQFRFLPRFIVLLGGYHRKVWPLNAIGNNINCHNMQHVKCAAQKTKPVTMRLLNAHEPKH
jgi:hypothetical protein